VTVHPVRRRLPKVRGGIKVGLTETVSVTVQNHSVQPLLLTGTTRWLAYDASGWCTVQLEPIDMGPPGAKSYDSPRWSQLRAAKTETFPETSHCISVHFGAFRAVQYVTGTSTGSVQRQKPHILCYTLASCPETERYVGSEPKKPLRSASQWLTLWLSVAVDEECSGNFCNFL